MLELTQSEAVQAAIAGASFLQALGVIGALIYTVQQARRQARDRETDARAAEDRHRELLSEQREILRIQVADRRRERLVKHYPAWVLSCYQYAQAAAEVKRSPSTGGFEKRHRCITEVFSRSMAIRLDDGEAAAHTVNEITAELVRWDERDSKEGFVIADKAKDHVESRILAFRGKA